jgi:hypothetical protein
VAGAAGGRRVSVTPAAAAIRTAQKRTKCHLAFGDSRLGSKSVNFFFPSDRSRPRTVFHNIAHLDIAINLSVTTGASETRGERRHRSQTSGNLPRLDSGRRIKRLDSSCGLLLRSVGAGRISNATHLSSKPSIGQPESANWRCSNIEAHTYIWSNSCTGRDSHSR